MGRRSMSTAASERAAYLARVERSARAALGLVEHYDGLDPKLSAPGAASAAS